MAAKKTKRVPVERAGAQLALRVPDDLIEFIDAEVERLRAERPGSVVHRSDVVRELLYKAKAADAKGAR